MSASLGSAGRVLRNSAVLMVSKILERATGFVMAILVTAHLGVDGLGIYATGWAIYALISTAGEAGATNYLVREISRDGSRTASYTVHLSIVAAIVAAGLTVLAEIVVAHIGYTAEMRAAVAVILLAIVPKVLNMIQEGVFVAHGKVAYETFTRLIASCTYVAIAAWMLAGGADVVELLRVFVAIEACVCVVYFVLINAFIARLWVRLSTQLAWQLVKEVRLFAASSAIAALFSRPEIVILSLLATPREVGLFSAGMRIAELGLLLPDVFMINVFPVLSGAFRTAEDVFARWQRIAVRAMLAYSLPLAACLLVGADDIVRLLFGDGFETAATVLRLLALNIVFFSLGAVFWRSLVARDGQRENVVIQSAMAVTRVGLGIVLIIPLSAVGAGIAGAATAGLNWWLLARATGRAGAPERVLALAWPFLPPAAVTAATAWILLDRVPTPVALFAAALVYVPAALATGAINAEDRSLLLAARTRRRPPVPARPAATDLGKT